MYTNIDLAFTHCRWAPWLNQLSFSDAVSFVERTVGTGQRGWHRVRISYCII
jgi:hypothetical protein